MYDSFIPTLSVDSDNLIENADDASSDQRKPQRRTNEKGALYHAYDLQVHQFVGHLRRVHPTNPSVKMTVRSKTVDVKAANPLAPSGHPLYYYHSRTAYYNNFFFMWWDKCLSHVFKNVLPFLEVRTSAAMERLLNMEMDG